MGKSDTVLVMSAKIPTNLIIDPPSVSEGVPPFTVRISGILVDANNSIGIGGATVNLLKRKSGATQWNKVGSAWTNSNPFAGALGVVWIDHTINESGDWEFCLEFLGDATYEGC